jgi:hypothetical protein
MVTERDGSRVTSHPDRPGRVPFELWIACPLLLPIWDRQQDDWRMVGADTDGILVSIGLDHREHPGIRGSLLVDTERRLALEYSTPFDTVVLDVAADPSPPGAFATYLLT